MFSACANPDCKILFDYREGRFFRFHKASQPGEQPPNTHSVQHLWLCGNCSRAYTLEYRDERGVVMHRQPDPCSEDEPHCFVAAA